MRASYLQPSSLQYSSFFLRKKGAKQAALILMKNTHFNRTPLYLLLNLQLLVCLQNLFVLDIFSKHIGIAIVGFVCTFMRGYNIHLSTFSKMGVYRVCTSFYPLLKLLKPLKPTFTKYGCCRLSNSGDVFDKKNTETSGKTKG